MDKHITLAQRLTIAFGFTLLFALGCFAGMAQDVTNYAFNTNDNETLEDMSSGTTQLIGASTNSTSSAVTDIGFDVWFMGERFTQFSVNTNGIFRFGSTVVSQYGNTFAISGQARITPISSVRTDGGAAPADAPLVGYHETSSTGKIHYKVIGSAPNRILVVEWLNMRLNHNSPNVSDATFQAHVYETAPAPTTTAGGVIRFLYGSMYANVENDVVTYPTFQYMTGIGYGAGTNDYLSVHVDDSPPTAAANETSTANGSTASGYLYTVTNQANITNLHSSSASARRYFNFEAPDVIGVPSNIAASCITTSTIDLSWSDPATTNGVGVVVYRSTDGTNYEYVTQVAMGVESYSDTGLSSGTTYYYRLYVVNEGKMSDLGIDAALTVATVGGGTVAYAINNGNWNAASTWSTGSQPDASTDVVISCNYTVTVTSSGANCNNLTIASGSSLEFNNNGSINIDGALTNAGTFNLEGTGISVNLAGNLTNTGTWRPGNASFTFDGSTAQSVSNTGTSQFDIAAASTTTTYTYTGPTSIPDDGGVNMDLSVATSGTITNITVDVDITHTYIGDLRGRLTSPDGTEVVLFSYLVGGSGNCFYNNINTTLDDDASTSIQDQCSASDPSVSGTHTPFASLTGFDGEDQQGTWRLRVRDAAADDTGELNSYRLNITTGGGTTTETSNDLAFYDFVMNNANGVTFTDDDARITHDLTLTNGVIAMGANEMIFIDGATADVGSNSTHVNGKIRKIGDDVFDFPCGNGTYVANLSISAPSATDDEFTCEYARIDPDATWDTDLKDNTIHNVSRQEYWLVEHPVGSSPVYISLSYDDTRSGGVGTPADLTVAHWTSGSWADEGRHGSLTPANYTGLTSNNALSSFSPITLASTTNNDNPLPVTLLDFTAQKKDEGVLLEWITATEENSDFFAIERSLDGKSFKEIGTVSAKGESNRVLDYHFMDYTVEHAGQVYYRLKMVDFDGSFEYSAVRSILFSVATLELQYIAPNPFTDYVDINFVLPTAESVQIVMTDLLGRQLAVNTLRGQQGANTFSLTSLARLPKGTYIVQLHYQGKILSKKLVK